MKYDTVTERNGFTRIGLAWVGLLYLRLPSTVVTGVLRMLLVLSYQNLIIAELRRPEGPPSGAPYSYREIKETHELFFSCYRRQRYFSWARTHDSGDGGDGGVAQRGGHAPNTIGW